MCIITGMGIMGRLTAWGYGYSYNIVVTTGHIKIWPVVNI